MLRSLRGRVGEALGRPRCRAAVARVYSSRVEPVPVTARSQTGTRARVLDVDFAVAVRDCSSGTACRRLPAVPSRVTTPAEAGQIVERYQTGTRTPRRLHRRADAAFTSCRRYLEMLEGAESSFTPAHCSHARARERFAP